MIGGGFKNLILGLNVWTDIKIQEKILINRLKHQLSNDKNISSTVISIRGFFIFGLTEFRRKVVGSSCFDQKWIFIDCNMSSGIECIEIDSLSYVILDHDSKKMNFTVCNFWSG